jgi:hypothetical protein
MFRIEIEEGTEAPRFTAHLLLLEQSGGIARPLAFPDGHRAEIHATSENLALNSAIAYLRDCFGVRS